jgi:hypothetical protein
MVTSALAETYFFVHFREMWLPTSASRFPFYPLVKACTIFKNPLPAPTFQSGCVKILFWRKPPESVPKQQEEIVPKRFRPDTFLVAFRQIFKPLASRSSGVQLRENFP